ncbi:MAG: ATP-binding cassette domain-containing protein [Planctomycetes bacterium]|nr:ATP-binding cassette domain-containing protein [Planctomycetota bacterium]
MENQVFMNNPVDDVIQVEALSLSYGERVALDRVSFSVRGGETFSLLGPNGGGKTTLFRILSTSLIPSSGAARILGFDVVRDDADIRRRMGVVFQSPSLDLKLTVIENLRHQGHLYGLKGRALAGRIDALLGEFGLRERAAERVEKLSGGLKRRVELAKGMLHHPDVLLMDEPTTGLDPVGRLDFWDYLGRVQSQRKVTILLTTHFMEEAEKSDRLGILDGGKLVGMGTPAELKAQVGGDVISVGCKEPEALRSQILEKFGVEAVLMDRLVRIERPRGHEFIPSLIEAFPGQVVAVTYGKPTLEDVFIHLTGRRLAASSDPEKT